MTLIRPERPADVGAIRDVTAAAFARVSEADLVESLRKNRRLLLSFVAENDGQVVGHVAFSPARIELSRGGHVEALALGPIAVLPDLQRDGIGSLLMERGFDECATLGHELVFLLGHPSYYPRFGFVPAKALGVRWEQDQSEHPMEPFMVKELRPGALADCLSGDIGVFYFAPDFDET